MYNVYKKSTHQTQIFVKILIIYFKNVKRVQKSIPDVYGNFKTCIKNMNIKHNFWKMVIMNKIFKKMKHVLINVSDTYQNCTTCMNKVVIQHYLKKY